MHMCVYVCPFYTFCSDAIYLQYIGHRNIPVTRHELKNPAPLCPYQGIAIAIISLPCWQVGRILLHKWVEYCCIWQVGRILLQVGRILPAARIKNIAAHGAQSGHGHKDGHIRYKGLRKTKKE